MQLMKTFVEDNVAHHAEMAVRLFTIDPVQADRINRAKSELVLALTHCLNKGITRPIIRELASGTGDIVGEFSFGTSVSGYDINENAMAVGRMRFPKMDFRNYNIVESEPIPGDVLVMCEMLEHMPEPKALVQKWMPHFETVVISHPVYEPLDSTLSNGGHHWSYEQADFLRWFDIGGHEVKHFYEFDMEHMRLIVGWGARKAT